MAQIGIALGLPFGGRLVHPKWALALKTVDFPVNTTQTAIYVENKPITQARNAIVDVALQADCKYLFFVDDDVVLPRHAIMALGSVLDNGIDEKVMVATGIYCTKTFAPAPVIYRDDNPGAFLNWRVNDVFDIDSCGAGCLMINTEVFQHLEKPYFSDTQEYKQDANTGDPAYNAVSEDIYFCRQVRAKGFKIKADGRVICPHYDNATNKFYTLPEDSLPFKREKERQQAEMKQEENNG